MTSSDTDERALAAPADRLRQAARVVRMASAAATPGRWEAVVDDHGRGQVDASVWADSISYYVTEKISSGGQHIADATWIALMSPVVGEALAKWLDDTAATVESVTRKHPDAVHEGSHWVAPALAAADAILAAVAR